MKESKQAYYMVIPSTVWNTDLNQKAVLLYGHISVLANKKGYCHANNKYFEKVLNISTATVGRLLNELKAKDLISSRVIYKEKSKEVLERRIYMNTGIIMDDNSPVITDDNRPVITDEPDNSTSSNTTRSNSKSDEVLAKIFFKIVEVYPKNRIGNRQHGLKKFQKLDIEQAKLAGKNLKRYLDVSREFVKNLQNYIEQECYTEEYLVAEETKNNRNNITNTKTFEQNYDNIS